MLTRWQKGIFLHFPIRFFWRSTVFFLFLALPPLLVVDEIRRQPGLSWACSIGFMTLFVGSMGGVSRPVRLLVSAAVGIFALANTALAISFIMQGTAFNSAFLAHLDLSTLRIAWQTDAQRIFGTLLYVLAAPCLTWWMTERPVGFEAWLSRSPTFLRIGLLALSFWLNYPLNAIADYRAASTTSSNRLIEEIARLRSEQPATDFGEGPRKNLLLIYLEGLEATYLDETLFPGLLPNLNARRQQAIRFSDMRQYPGTGWTIGGIVSSQCGVPLLSEKGGNSVLREVDNPFAQVICLAEYLKAAGYRTAYIGGASLDFAGKGNFLKDNGFDIVLGLDELPNATAHNWGMYDVDLLAHAKVLFEQLSAEESPFLLTLLTLDTHHPTGTPSPGCNSYPGHALLMLDAVHCTDQLLSDFLDFVGASPLADNTVIALVSDHLFIKGDVEEELDKRDRRLLFWLFDPEREGADRTGPGAHFDIAPTLLESVGLKNAAFPFGHSLLSHEEGRAQSRNLMEEDFEPFKIEALIAPD